MTTATHDTAQAAAEIDSMRFELRGFLIAAALLLSWVVLLLGALAFLD